MAKQFGFVINLSGHATVTTEHESVTPWMAERILENRLRYFLEQISDVIPIDGIEISLSPTVEVEL